MDDRSRIRPVWQCFRCNRHSCPARICRCRSSSRVMPQLVRDCMRDNNPRFGVVLISQGREVGGGDVRCDVGTVARITECVEIAGSGRFMLRCRTAERIKVCEWLPDDPYPRAIVAGVAGRAGRSGECRPTGGPRRPDDGTVRTLGNGQAICRCRIGRMCSAPTTASSIPENGCTRWRPAFPSGRPTATRCWPRRRPPSGWQP